ncbi:uncharacterized protein [Clytia hemisphaerica]|uniref:uncharacterized protein isoform X2 n=1 Tax=Clytia hemisphaerica TaxID=252671 RepID=UPI0034D51224
MPSKQKTLIYQFVLCVNLTIAHNILRIDDTRIAKFVLRHEDKVHVTPHYKELNIEEEAACVDRCVTETQCKSVNFYKNDTDAEESKCQLVAEDIDDLNEYMDRVGWRHLDTGKTSITRLKHPNGYCWVPEVSSPCDFSVSNVELQPLSSSKCQDISAYFDFDRSWSGTIIHVCSGKMLCPASTAASGNPITLVDVHDCTFSDQYLDGRKKFRRNPYGFLEFAPNLCVAPSGNAVSTAYDMTLTSTCTSTAARLTYDFVKGPIKVSIFLSMGSRTFENFEAAIRSRQNSPSSIIYMDVFMQRTKTWDYHGMRMESVLQAPATGEYRFNLIANQYSKLYFGRDESEGSKEYCAGSHEHTVAHDI